MKNKKVLIACEESQAVTIEMRKIGLEAYSCDIQPCSGGHPEWHLQQDVIPLLQEDWGLIIAHPPCTYLANSGSRWMYKDWQKDENKTLDAPRYQKMLEGTKFFRLFLDSKCERVAIENPIMHCWAREVLNTKYTQIIQPFHHGHEESKSTCLWLKGLPNLKKTKEVQSKGSNIHKMWLSIKKKDRKKERSKTFPGIAKAMADQWGRLLLQ